MCLEGGQLARGALFLVNSAPAMLHSGQEGLRLGQFAFGMTVDDENGLFCEKPCEKACETWS